MVRTLGETNALSPGPDQVRRAAQWDSFQDEGAVELLAAFQSICMRVWCAVFRVAGDMFRHPTFAQRTSPWL